MEIFIKNIGKVKEANIKINGITVIAGENDTGKSTISKALFTVFNSFYNIDKKIKTQRENIITDIIDKNTSKIEFFNNTIFKKTSSINYISNEIVKNSEMYKINNKLKDEILGYFKNFNLKLKNSNIEEISQEIKIILNITNEDAEKVILNANLNNEFNKQINYIY